MSFWSSNLPEAVGIPCLKNVSHSTCSEIIFVGEISLFDSGFGYWIFMDILGHVFCFHLFPIFGCGRASMYFGDVSWSNSAFRCSFPFLPTITCMLVAPTILSAQNSTNLVQYRVPNRRLVYFYPVLVNDIYDI